MPYKKIEHRARVVKWQIDLNQAFGILVESVKFKIIAEQVHVILNKNEIKKA